MHIWSYKYRPKKNCKWRSNHPVDYLMSFDWSYACSFQQDLLTVQMVSQRDAMLSQSAPTAFVFRCWVFYGICVAFAIYVKWTSFIQGIKFSISSSKLWFERQWFSFASPNYPVNFGFLSFLGGALGSLFEAKHSDGERLRKAAGALSMAVDMVLKTVPQSVLKDPGANKLLF